MQRMNTATMGRITHRSRRTRTRRWKRAEEGSGHIFTYRQRAHRKF